MQILPDYRDAFSPHVLRQIDSIVSTLFLAEAGFDADLIAKKIAELFRKAEDKQAVSLFINWLA